MTEQKYTRLYVQRYWLWWAGALVVGLIVGYIMTNHLSTSYQGAVSFTVTHPTQSVQGSTYAYDGYYSSESANNQRDDLAAWLQSPTNVQAILSAANQSSATSVSALNKYFTDNTLQPSNQLNLTFTSTDKNSATAIGNALVSYVNQNYKADGYTITAGAPYVAEQATSRTLIVAAATFGLFLASIVITLFVYYFTEEA